MIDQKISFLKEQKEKVGNILEKRLFDEGIASLEESRNKPSEVLGGFNLYGFVNNSTLNHYDLLGLSAVDCALATCKLAAVTGGSVAYVAGAVAACLAPEPTGVTKALCVAAYLGAPQLGVELANAIDDFINECFP